MLDFAAILTASGLVLWQYVAGDETALSRLSAHVFFEDSARTNFEVEGSKLHWLQDSRTQLVFLVAAPRVLATGYQAEMLQRMRKDFLSAYDSQIGALCRTSEHTVSFWTTNAGWRGKFLQWDAAFGKLAASYSELGVDRRTVMKSGLSAPADAVNSAGTASEGAESDEQNANTIARNIEMLRAQRASRTKGKTMRTGGMPSSTSSGISRSQRKDARKWNGLADDPGQLDFSGTDIDAGAAGSSLTFDRHSMGTRTTTGDYEVADYDASRAASQSRIATLFGRMAGGLGLGSHVLTLESMQPALDGVKELLVGKNVAQSIAEGLCSTVGATLAGRKVSALEGGIATAVQRAMESALTERLTPKSPSDTLADIRRRRRVAAGLSSKPYTLVFVGVNGVGKSTNLSKVAFWLLQNRLRVLVAACDTFRSGAVEQLRVHIRNLGELDVDAAVDRPFIELYERGYGKDAAGIAKDAIAYAAANGFDVVLVDTAGRMQDNEPLMRSLAKLVTVNDPDKVLFVGEALVGNEAVDQLSRFDKALRSFSGMGGRSRGIDGVILTKVDTADEKVGAAVSMACTTGCPILFIGTGQTYSDLRSLRVSSIVAALMR